jgi:hypothetical protein
VKTPIKITSSPIKHNKYSLLIILIVSQLANKQIGISKVVNTTKNKLIPSIPKKKAYSLVQFKVNENWKSEER